jgi:hypothetical protein
MCGEATQNYEYTVEDSKVCVKKELSGSYAVIIPEKISDMPVAKISSHAFENNETKVVILPETIMEVENKAFHENIEKVVFMTTSAAISMDSFENEKTVIVGKEGSRVHEFALSHNLDFIKIEDEDLLQEVTFTDKSLEDSLRTRLDRDKLLKAELLNIKNLELEIIHTFEDLILLNNLENLSLLKVCLDVDYFSLTSLDSLIELRITDSKLSDVTFLNYMQGIEILDLSNNYVIDIMPLMFMNNIKVLDLANNSISDIYTLEDIAFLGGYQSDAYINLDNNLIDFEMLQNQFIINNLIDRNITISAKNQSSSHEIKGVVFNDENSLYVTLETYIAAKAADLCLEESMQIRYIVSSDEKTYKLEDYTYAKEILGTVLNSLRYLVRNTLETNIDYTKLDISSLS